MFRVVIVKASSGVDHKMKEFKFTNYRSLCWGPSPEDGFV
jgi:hypothetical protein